MVHERDDRIEGGDGLEDMDEVRQAAEMEPLLARVRSVYHAPPPTPRDDMWVAIEGAMAHRKPATGRDDARVVSLADERRRRIPAFHRMAGWAVAAAAVLVLGVGIGRMSVRPAGTDGLVAEVPNPTAMRLAAVDHLGRTESLLTLVRLDAHEGKLDPQVGPWARSLLSQTRLLLDAPEEEDPAMKELLQDLELVLAQIVGVTDTGGHDAARTRTELNLAVKGLADSDLLPRIQAVVPVGSGMAGT